MRLTLVYMEGGARILEALAGEYASGKSENAVHRALDLARRGRRVTLVDLDLEEPCYTLRPLHRVLAAAGVELIAWETSELLGLGETGMLLHPRVGQALARPGDVIFDLGHGAAGTAALNLVTGAREAGVQVQVVVNIARPLTGTVAGIVELVRGLGRVAGLINNPYLGEETTLELVEQGVEVVSCAARYLGLPVVATSVPEELASLLGDRDGRGHAVRAIRPFLTRAFW